MNEECCDGCLRDAAILPPVGERNGRSLNTDSDSTGGEA
jgi:hypothetical protein